MEKTVPLQKKQNKIEHFSYELQVIASFFTTTYSLFRRYNFDFHLHLTHTFSNSFCCVISKRYPFNLKSAANRMNCVDNFFEYDLKSFFNIDVWLKRISIGGWFAFSYLSKTETLLVLQDKHTYIILSSYENVLAFWKLSTCLKSLSKLSWESSEWTGNTSRLFPLWFISRYDEV